MNVQQAAGSASTQSRNQQRVVQAAMRCFERFGPDKTTLEDVAKEAGVDRKTVYRAFKGRDSLVEAVAIERMDAIRDALGSVLDRAPTLGEAVVAGILESLRLFRRDKLLMAAINATHDHGAERYLIDPRSPMLQNMLDLWHDVFARGRAAGELRKDIADTELSSWLLGVHLLLLLREDLDTAGQERMLRTFVLPGLHAR